MVEIRNRVKQVWYRLDSVVGLYAKGKGINVTTLFILECLAEEDELYTQKILCEKLMLPKQLVNAVIKSFWEQGFVDLKEAKDRRHKNIMLTEKGKEYAESIINPLNEADERAWDRFSQEELINTAELLEKYAKAMEECVRGMV